MSDMKPQKPRTTFSGEEARNILAHAAKFDSVIGSSYSAADLRRAAEEANIHPAAIDAALAQIELAKTRASSRSKLMKTLGFGALGALFGAVAIGIDQMGLGSAAAAAVFGPSGAFALYRALRNRWQGSIKDFIREIGIFFGTFSVTAILMEGTSATGPALLWSISCALAGAGIVAVDFRSTSRSENASLDVQS